MLKSMHNSTLDLVRPLTRPINTQVAITRKAEVLEQEAALEVFVGVQNGIEFARVPQVFIFDLFRDVSISREAAAVGVLGHTFLISFLCVDSKTRLQAMW